METDTQKRTVGTPVEARGGFLDRPVLLVLVTSFALAVGGMFLAFFGVFKF